MSHFVQTSPAHRRWAALDGLRGVAILLVFGFHLPWGAFRTGSIGVILFFVLSGFLITTILLRELDRTGKVDFRRFYFRRARRLLPALLLVSVAYLLLQVTIFGQPEKWWERTWPALGYISNYASIGGMDLAHMTPTWSLAIEEHFYLLWPLALVFIPARGRFRATAGLAAGFLLWRIALLTSGAPDVRVSFGTDSNAFAPLLGCALAVGFHENRFKIAGKNASAFYTAGLIGVACIPLHYTNRLVIWLGVPVAILATFAIHAALTAPVSWLETRPLRWLGTISYGLYLWHFLLIPLPWERLPLRPLLWMTVVPLLVAWLSWRYVEEPLIRRPQYFQVGAAAPRLLPRELLIDGRPSIRVGTDTL